MPSQLNGNPKNLLPETSSTQPPESSLKYRLGDMVNLASHANCAVLQNSQRTYKGFAAAVVFAVEGLRKKKGLPSPKRSFQLRYFGVRYM